MNILSQKQIKDTDYICLSAMLRAKEARMLTKDRIERILYTPEFADAAKLLTECGYPDMSDMGIVQINAELEKHRSEVFAELAKSAPDPILVDVFRIKYDYHNIKVLIKSEAAEAAYKDLMSYAGRTEPEKLASLFFSDRLSQLPGTLGQAVSAGKSILARTGNPQISDIAVDRMYFTELLQIAKETKCDFLTDYVKMLIDASNLRAAVRMKRIGQDYRIMVDSLIEGGTVSVSRLLTALTSDEDLSLSFSSSPLAQAALLGAEAVFGAPLTPFERECDNALTSFLSGAKLIGFGPEPLIAFLAAVENEISTVRVIMTGKLNGIDPDVIKERLRESYA